MTLFTDNPFEKSDDTEAGLRQRGKIPAGAFFPTLRGLPFTETVPLCGVLYRKTGNQTTEPNDKGEIIIDFCIAEKPSVAQTIAAVLGAKEKKDGFLTGSGYLVSWCVGHLVGLSEAAAYGEQYKEWSYDSLPILPQEWKYTVAADKEKQFKTLKELMHRADVSEVVNACDAGREGRA